MGTLAPGDLEVNFTKGWRSEGWVYQSLFPAKQARQDRLKRRLALRRLFHFVYPIPCNMGPEPARLQGWVCSPSQGDWREHTGIPFFYFS